MKKIIVFALLLRISVASFSQQITITDPSVAKTDYQQKSKEQKSTATILVVGGGVLITIGGVLGLDGFSKGLDFSNPGSSAGVSEVNTGNTLAIAGGILILGSIPFIIAKVRNEKKAMSLSIKNENCSQIQKSSFVYKPVPSLTLQINL